MPLDDTASDAEQAPITEAALLLRLARADRAAEAKLATERSRAEGLEVRLKEHEAAAKEVPTLRGQVAELHNRIALFGAGINPTTEDGQKAAAKLTRAWKVDNEGIEEGKRPAFAAWLASPDAAEDLARYRKADPVAAAPVVAAAAPAVEASASSTAAAVSTPVVVRPPPVVRPADPALGMSVDGYAQDYAALVTKRRDAPKDQRPAIDKEMEALRARAPGRAR